MADSLYGRLSLITGPEQFLAEREVARLVARAQAEDASAAIITATGADLTPNLLDQMAGTDLFSTSTIACISAAERTPKAIDAALLGLAINPPPNTALIIAHAGGNLGRPLLDKLTPYAARVIECPVLKPGNLARFVSQEVLLAGKTITADAAQNLVEAIGQDTRSLAGAVSQLVADTDSNQISSAIVNRYFVGRATVTAFAVSDDALTGRVGEAIIKLRWALSTGVDHVLITGSLATSLRRIGNYLSIARQRPPTAAEIGVPTWKLKDFAKTATAWSERSVGLAIRAVALADAQIKGAGQDPDFALERLIIRLASLRRAGASAS